MMYIIFSSQALSFSASLINPNFRFNVFHLREHFISCSYVSVKLLVSRGDGKCSLFLICTATHKEIVVFFRRYGWIGERLALDRKHFTEKNQYERRKAVQQQPNILFVTGKYCIYIPTHCFQFACATQPLVFNWIQICMKKDVWNYCILLFIIIMLRCQMDTTKKLPGSLHSKVLNQISCMGEFFFDIIICT